MPLGTNGDLFMAAIDPSDICLCLSLIGISRKDKLLDRLTTYIL